MHFLGYSRVDDPLDLEPWRLMFMCFSVVPVSSEADDPQLERVKEQKGGTVPTQCGTVLSDEATLFVPPSFPVSRPCLFLHFFCFFCERPSNKTKQQLMYSPVRGPAKFRGSCQAQPFRCACVCMLRECMHESACQRPFVCDTHLCLTGKPHSSRLGAKGEKVSKEENKTKKITKRGKQTGGRSRNGLLQSLTLTHTHTHRAEGTKWGKSEEGCAVFSPPCLNS